MKKNNFGMYNMNLMKRAKNFSNTSEIDSSLQNRIDRSLYPLNKRSQLSRPNTIHNISDYEYKNSSNNYDLIEDFKATLMKTQQLTNELMQNQSTNMYKGYRNNYINNNYNINFESKISSEENDSDKNYNTEDLEDEEEEEESEDEKSSNSAEFRGQILHEGNEIKPKAKTTRFNSIFNSKKAMERYTERMKDRNMILDIEKRNQETVDLEEYLRIKNSI